MEITEVIRIEAETSLTTAAINDSIFENSDVCELFRNFMLMTVKLFIGESIEAPSPSLHLVSSFPNI